MQLACNWPAWPITHIKWLTNAAGSRAGGLTRRISVPVQAAATRRAIAVARDRFAALYSAPAGLRQGDRSCELDHSTPARDADRTAQVPARAGEVSGAANDYVGERTAEGPGRVGLARAGAGWIAEDLVDVDRAACEVDGAKVAAAAAGAAEQDRFGRLAKRNDLPLSAGASLKWAPTVASGHDWFGERHADRDRGRGHGL